jgi:hypothetical protein
MPPIAKRKFAHRQNKDGTFDSICCACLATIISLKDDDDLALYEASHRCDPIKLYQLQSLITRQRSNPGN